MTYNVAFDVHVVASYSHMFFPRNELPINIIGVICIPWHISTPPDAFHILPFVLKGHTDCIIVFCILTSVVFCSFLCTVYSLRLKCSSSSCTPSCVPTFVSFIIIVQLKINIYLSMYPHVEIGARCESFTYTL